MNHWLVAPLVLPLVTGALLLMLDRARPVVKRWLGIAATVALVPMSFHLLSLAADGVPKVYYLGDWPAPFGIVLVLDHLSALMVTLCALVATASVVHAATGDDTRGPYFHALLQFQLLGINGAFLTGDLFNLFVFFEILLIASYCLLMHGANPARTRAAMHVVLLNLTGSALFLIALGLVYGVFGTLNMADLAGRFANVSHGDAGLARTGGLLLLVVFGLKAAFVPLGFWLPNAYRNATASVACLFAIMTKVGVYSILRVHLLIYGDSTGPGVSLAEPWLLWLGLATIMLGVLGLVAASALRSVVAYLVVISVGTLVAGIGLFSKDAIAAALFYMVHSTLIIGGLFLLADLISRQRGASDDRLDAAQSVVQPALLGSLFFIGAVSIAGLPPSSGFLTKILLLKSALASPALYWFWGIVLGAGLLTIVSLARAGSALFWRTDGTQAVGPPLRLIEAAPTVALLASAGVLMVLAADMSTLTQAAAAQLLDPTIYVDAVLTNAGVSPPASTVEVRP